MVYPVDDTQGQGFAVESFQDLNFRLGIQIFGQYTDQKLTLICCIHELLFISQTNKIGLNFRKVL